MRILIAEDDEGIQDVLVDILGGEGHSCRVASNGRIAANFLSEDSSYDLLISDFRMPEMDGVQLLEWCRNSKIHFPVIFITATSNLVDREKVALEDCCAEMLEKPFEISSLLVAVEDAKLRNHQRECLKNKSGAEN
jgi:DNA-binding NtrC family response regulator